MNLREPTAEQLQKLLACVAQGLGLPTPCIDACQALVKWRITPGDVAAVVRRQAFVPLDTSAALMAALVAEAKFKPEASGQAMGFV